MYFCIVDTSSPISRRRALTLTGASLLSLAGSGVESANELSFESGDATDYDDDTSSVRLHGELLDLGGSDAAMFYFEIAEAGVSYTTEVGWQTLTKQIPLGEASIN